MTDTPASRDQEILADIAERAYALACKVQDQAMVSDDAEAVARLGAQFHQAARTVGQTLALKASLDHGAQRRAREAASEAAQDTQAEVAARRTQVAAHVRCAIYRAYRGYQATNLRDDLDRRLDAEVLQPGFGAETLEAHIMRLSAELGLAAGDGQDDEGGPKAPVLDIDPARRARIEALLAAVPDEPDEPDEEDEADEQDWASSA